MIKIYGKAPMQGISRAELSRKDVVREDGCKEWLLNSEQMEKTHMEHMELFLTYFKKILK